MYVVPLLHHPRDGGQMDLSPFDSSPAIVSFNVEAILYGVYMNEEEKEKCIDQTDNIQYMATKGYTE